MAASRCDELWKCRYSVVRATLDALVTASMVTASTPPVLRSAAAASSSRLRDRILRGSMASSGGGAGWPLSLTGSPRRLNVGRCSCMTL